MGLGQAGQRRVRFSGALAQPLKIPGISRNAPGSVRRSSLRDKRFLTGASGKFLQSAGTRKHSPEKRARPRSERGGKIPSNQRDATLADAIKRELDAGGKIPSNQRDATLQCLVMLNVLFITLLSVLETVRRFWRLLIQRTLAVPERACNHSPLLFSQTLTNSRVLHRGIGRGWERRGL